MNVSPDWGRPDGLVELTIRTDAEREDQGLGTNPGVLEMADHIPEPWMLRVPKREREERAD